MIGTTLNNRYHLEAELGHGGMGVVYRARDLSLNRGVAIKVLPPEFSMDAQFLQRFKNEVLNVAKLDHPNIVQIYDVGQEGMVNYYVMQLVEGSDLHGTIARYGRFSLAETIRITKQVALALDYAHEQGIVHRDIKPDNILLDSKGSPRVVDFGIAKTVEGTRMTGGMIGTPEYMSPEQARGEALDGRADQYALAIVVYEMLTGTTPFRSDTAQAWSLVNAHITVQPPDPRQYQGDLPEHVVVSLMQAMAKMPENRFLTCTQFADALNGYVEFTIPSVIKHVPAPTVVSQSVPQSSIPVIMPPSPPSKQGMMGFLGAMVGILLLGGVLLIFGQKDGGNNPPDKPQETSITAPPPQPPSDTVISEPVPDTPTQDEDQTQVDPPVDKSKYLWLLERPVTESDMQGMSKKELEIMRNDVYASHGWIFKRQDLRDYYFKQPWYKPGGTPSQRDVVNNNINYNMSKLEKANTAKILAHEKALGGE